MYIVCVCVYVFAPAAVQQVNGSRVCGANDDRWFSTERVFALRVLYIHRGVRQIKLFYFHRSGRSTRSDLIAHHALNRTLSSLHFFAVFNIRSSNQNLPASMKSHQLQLVSHKTAYTPGATFGASVLLANSKTTQRNQIRAGGGILASGRAAALIESSV